MALYTIKYNRNYWLKMWDPGKIQSYSTKKKKNVVPVLKLLRWNLLPLETHFSIVEIYWKVLVCFKKLHVAHHHIPTHFVINKDCMYQTAYSLGTSSIVHMGFFSVLQLYASFISKAFVAQNRAIFTISFWTHSLSYVLKV